LVDLEIYHIDHLSFISSHFSLSLSFLSIEKLIEFDNDELKEGRFIDQLKPI